MSICCWCVGVGFVVNAKVVESLSDYRIIGLKFIKQFTVGHPPAKHFVSFLIIHAYIVFSLNNYSKFIYFKWVSFSFLKAVRLEKDLNYIQTYVYIYILIPSCINCNAYRVFFVGFFFACLLVCLFCDLLTIIYIQM